MKFNKVQQLYSDLIRKHGNPVILWPQWCAKKKERSLREIIAIGAILTQRTSWHNADLAMRNLKKAGLLSLKKLAGLENYNELTKLIKPAGFYQTKPKRLFALSSFVVNEYGNINGLMKEKPAVLRKKLLGLYGIGPETADTILLYALDKPSFIVDTYTKRLVEREKLSDIFKYDYLKRFFETSLPKNYTVFQNLHALIIIEQKGRKRSLMEIV